VEWAFRTCKTVHLEARPLYVRRASRTRGHALVVMLTYRLVAELARAWRHLDATVLEGIAALATLCTSEVSLAGQASFQSIPQPSASVAELLSAANVWVPIVLPHRNVRVTTKRKLPPRRKTRRTPTTNRRKCPLIPGEHTLSVIEFKTPSLPRRAQSDSAGSDLLTVTGRRLFPGKSPVNLRPPSTRSGHPPRKSGLRLAVRWAMEGF
jgi:hypothetical protein